MITVKVHTDEVKRMLREIPRDLRDRAIAAGINKVAPKVRTEMVRAITTEFAIKAAEVRPRISLYRASRNRLTASLDPFASRRRGRSLNLIRFTETRVSLAEARRRAKDGSLNQLRFKIKRAGGMKTIPGAFIGNKGRTVFRRVGKSSLPIQALSTIDVPQMFNTRRIANRVVARIDRELPVEMRRAIDFVLRKYR